MIYSAKVTNEQGKNQVTLRTGDREHSLEIPPQASGYGSRANGGELLFLALASCYCNVVYREAAREGIDIQGVEVEVQGGFAGPGQPAGDVHYSAKVVCEPREAEVCRLLETTDCIAEIQQTVRLPTPVKLAAVEVTRPQPG